MAKRSRQAVAVFALCLAALGSAEAQGVTRLIGEQAVVLPVPSGMRESASPEVLALAQKMVPSTNRLLAVFLTASDDQRVRRGEFPLLERYVFVQSARSVESRQMTASQFERLKSSMRSSLPATAARVTPKANTELSQNLRNEDLQVRVETPEIDGVFVDSSSAFGFVMVSNVQAESSAARVQHKMGVTTLISVPRTKVVFFYAYETLVGSTRVNWGPGVARGWLSQLEAANR